MYYNWIQMYNLKIMSPNRYMSSSVKLIPLANHTKENVKRHKKYLLILYLLQVFKTF